MFILNLTMDRIVRKQSLLPNHYYFYRQTWFFIILLSISCYNFLLTNIVVVEGRTEPLTFCLPFRTGENTNIRNNNNNSNNNNNNNSSSVIDKISEKSEGVINYKPNLIRQKILTIKNKSQIFNKKENIRNGTEKKSADRLYLCTIRPKRASNPKVKITKQINSNIRRIGKRTSETYNQFSPVLLPPGSSSSIDRHFITRNPERRLQLLNRLKHLMMRKKFRSIRNQNYEDSHPAAGESVEISHQGKNNDPTHYFNEDLLSSNYASYPNQQHYYPSENHININDQKPNHVEQNKNEVSDVFKHNYIKNYEHQENNIHSTPKPEKELLKPNSLHPAEMSQAHEGNHSAARPGEKFLAASVLAVIVAGIGVLFLAIVAYVGLIVQNKVPRKESAEETSEEDELNVERIKKGLYSIHFHYGEKEEKEKDKKKSKKKEEEEKERKKERASEILEFIREIIAVDAYSHHLGAGSMALATHGLELATGQGGGEPGGEPKSKI